ncbi:hypothetical protein RFI_01085 [Reticulomyxa filosa]|uniref:Uncharacterized protein n=1 Tax=Reticulomyxa filosa TaxID=46433 RepID=X6PE73_RETFI|nr:hypothetical protein RFI_01085 [Reticulomyxa filosa]|eukprot:ETO35977.1 hypothetical protein RFI_01085 [Reticulomyxa filosa]
MKKFGLIFASTLNIILYCITNKTKKYKQQTTSECDQKDKIDYRFKKSIEMNLYHQMIYNFLITLSYTFADAFFICLVAHQPKDYKIFIIYLDHMIKVFIQLFNGHTNEVFDVEYSPFVIKNSVGNSNVICSESSDNTIRFWDIRSNKNELYMIKGDAKEDDGIYCLKFIGLKKKDKTNNVKYDLNLCYGSDKGHIRIWG